MVGMVAACVPAMRSDPAAGLVTEEVKAEQRTIEEALTQMRNGDDADALGNLEKAIRADTFDQIDERTRHQVLSTAGMLLLNRLDYARAHAYLVLSSNSSQGTGVDWLARLRAGYALNDMEDAGRCLVTLAGAWPETFKRVDEETIQYVANKLDQMSQQEPNRQLLEALFKSHWKLDGGVEPAGMWQSLMRLRLEQGDFAGAMAAAELVDSPTALIITRADNRYAALVHAMPDRFDVDKAVAAKVMQMRLLVEQHPRSLKWLNSLADALLLAGRFEEALTLTTEALTRAKPVEDQQPAYDDIARQLNWVMNSRASALRALQRWDEAVAQLAAAARRPERGDINVSQTLNLALLYLDLDRPDDALATVSELGQLSPYGRMVLEDARLVAAAEKRDSAGVDKSLQFIREHSDDSPAMPFFALLDAGRLDEAAQALQALLADPLRRYMALRYVQHYAAPPQPPRLGRRMERLRALCARPDVQEAIAKVGKVEQYAIYLIPH